MKISVPELSLVLLMGPSGSGKSSFARQHFRETEVVSSDRCRALISDSEENQDVSSAAFDLLHLIVEKRLEAGRFTVVDATNLGSEGRKKLFGLAQRFHFFPAVIAFDRSEDLCIQANLKRSDREVPVPVIKTQVLQMKEAIRSLKREKLRYFHIIDDRVDSQSIEVERQKLWSDLRDETGPFDIIGDVHGCYDELCALLIKMEYQQDDKQEWFHPEGRKLIFLGDLVDRGPHSPAVLRMVMSLIKNNRAICVPGNHDIKFLDYLRGRKVKLNHGLDMTVAQMAGEDQDFKKEVFNFLEGLVSHHVLDEGRLVVAHAGMKEKMQGRGSARVRSFALYGESTGEISDFGIPVRIDWAESYRGKAMVVYGHTPVTSTEWVHNTLNIDTGCVFGGKLTALRYPEKEIVSVVAAQVYCVPTARERKEAEALPETNHLSSRDVLKRKAIRIAHGRDVYISEEQASSAFEILSRFAIDPRWLIYLPPTMGAIPASANPFYLEHPEEAFAYFEKRGIGQVVCQEKHMGSRAIVVLCKNAEVAKTRFGIRSGEFGIVYTRTGKRFFNDRSMENEFLECLRDSLSNAGIFQELKSDWICMDGELMPWSFKARDLLIQQYAAVGQAGILAVGDSLRSLQSALNCGLPVEEAVKREEERLVCLGKYREAYRRYCWPTQSVADLRYAPFHILASEGAVHVDKGHKWHLCIAARLNEWNPLFVPTRSLIVDVRRESERSTAAASWEKLTEDGAEGFVVKPFNFQVFGQKGLLQPALKVRGKEYLRIIYGPEYTLEENMKRLKKRNVAVKQALALKEFSLGVEGLQRFVKRESLLSIHECMAGILALESETVDPRL